MDVKRILEDFDEGVVARGRAYFCEGRVLTLEEVVPDEYEAVVEGSEDYEVSVSLSNGECVDLRCECPYGGNPYCKHVVAVLLAIGELRSRPAVAAKGGADPLSPEALAGLSREALLSLLRKVAEEFPQAHDWLRARLAPGGEDIRFYREMIQKAVRAQMERGFIPYAKMRAALRGTEAALSHLEELAADGAPGHALDFALMLIGEMLYCVENGDDSGGGPGSVIERCLMCVLRLYEGRVSSADEAAQRAFSRKLLEAAASGMFAGWADWRDELLGICVRIADRLPDLRAQVLALREADTKPPAGQDADYDRYRVDWAQERYFELLLRWQGGERAMQFVLDNLENDQFCRRVVDAHCEGKRYQEALALCLECEQRADDRLGLARQWMTRRYEIYEQMRDQGGMRALGEQLLLDGDDEYYERLKALYPAQEWQAKRSALLERLENDCGVRRAYLRIILAEGDRSRVLRYVRMFPQDIDALYMHLLPDYADEVRALFEESLRRAAARAFGRPAYLEVCERIATYARACGPAAAMALVEELQAAYPRKRAFQEELRRVAKPLLGEEDRAR